MGGEAILGVLLAVATAGALGWKWQLGVLRAMLATGLLALAPALAVALVGRPEGGGALAVGIVWLIAIVLSAGVLVYRFVRDPDRTPPDRDDVVVSPADGEVVYVRRCRAGRMPASSKRMRDHTLDELRRTPLHIGDAVVIGISLSFLDVHVNRSPVAGRIVRQYRHPGRFASLRRPEAVFENERATIVIARGGMQLAVVMIASRLVRRIVTLLREGDEVGLGQRLGAIRFGSQVDLVLPLSEAAAIFVEPGDRVVAGETIVALTIAAAPSRPAIGSGLSGD